MAMLASLLAALLAAVPGLGAPGAVRAAGGWEAEHFQFAVSWDGDWEKVKASDDADAAMVALRSTRANGVLATFAVWRSAAETPEEIIDEFLAHHRGVKNTDYWATGSYFDRDGVFQPAIIGFDGLMGSSIEALYPRFFDEAGVVMLAAVANGGKGAHLSDFAGLTAGISIAGDWGWEPFTWNFGAGSVRPAGGSGSGGSGSGSTGSGAARHFTARITPPERVPAIRLDMR
jgi:hypothetical protein